MPNREIHYAKAPITEAVIDVRVRPAAPISMDELAKLQDTERPRYPNVRRPLRLEVQFSESEERTEAKTTSTPIGHAFVSTDGLLIWEVRLDGMALHRLQPYETWAKFSAEAKRLWAIYSRQFEIAEIEAVILRYINRVEVSRGTKIDKILRVYPEIPPQLPGGTRNFAFTLDLTLDESSRLIVNEGLLPPSQPGVIPILLDLTIIKQAASAYNSAEQLWATIEVIKDHMNDAFENSITDDLREVIR